MSFIILSLLLFVTAYFLSSTGSLLSILHVLLLSFIVCFRAFVFAIMLVFQYDS